MTARPALVALTGAVCGMLVLAMGVVGVCVGRYLREMRQT